MPISLAASLRRQADECLRIAKLTTDEMYRAELVNTATWLHEKADRFDTPTRLARPSRFCAVATDSARINTRHLVH
jgi:hypothetical protein